MGRRYEVWRGSPESAEHNVRDSFHWRWRARLSAWLRTRAGWAQYEVRDRRASGSPEVDLPEARLAKLFGIYDEDA